MAVNIGEGKWDPAFCVGQEVEVRYKGGENYCPGKVRSVSTSNGTYDIIYDDRVVGLAVAESEIRQQCYVEGHSHETIQGWTVSEAERQLSRKLDTRKSQIREKIIKDELRSGFLQRNKLEVPKEKEVHKHAKVVLEGTPGGQASPPTATRPGIEIPVQEGGHRKTLLNKMSTLARNGLDQMRRSVRTYMHSKWPILGKRRDRPPSVESRPAEKRVRDASARENVSQDEMEVCLYEGEEIDGPEDDEGEMEEEEEPLVQAASSLVRQPAIFFPPPRRFNLRYTQDMPAPAPVEINLTFELFAKDIEPLKTGWQAPMACVANNDGELSKAPPPPEETLKFGCEF